jgi:hypothetical protein
MTTEFQASSSSQKPHTGPQPAPLPLAIQAASPPTRQSLKNWWKTFRPPQKAPETHGNSPTFRFQSFKQYPSLFPPVSVRDRKKASCSFTESAMSKHTPAREGSPDGGEPLAPVSRKERRFSSYTSVMSSWTLGTEANRRHSTFIQRDSQKGLEPMQSRSVLVPSFCPPDMSNKRASWNPFVTQTEAPSSDLVASKLPTQRGIQLSKLFDNFLLRNSSSQFERNTKSPHLVQQPTGIFGVPLRQSITYANVAISLVDAEGRSYIYGYVPIVVAKCGVYLKEKGLL